ncbi:MAG: hypothetical protein RL199_226 [Pseudomonadota bacterium]
MLEVERFDRVGLDARRGTLSLALLDDELFGARDSWTQAAERLHASRLLCAEDARRLCFLDAFGAAIGNDDRHFGNAGFFADDLLERPALRLAPVYDMLPMSLAPRAGVVPSLTGRPPLPRALHLPSWSDALALAGRYGRRVAGEPRISPAFRQGAGRLSAAIG